MPAAQTGATVSTDGIDFVDEDNAGRLFLSLLKHIADTRRTDTHEHLNEIRTRNREKRYFCLAGDRLCKQGLPRTGLTCHQNTARNTAAQLLESRRISQKLNELLHVFFCFIHAGNVCKGRGNLIFAQQTRFALTEAHWAAAATATALHLAHEEHKYGDNDQDRKAGYQELHPNTLLFWFLTLNNDLMLQHVIHQLRIFHHGADRLESRTIVALGVYSKAINHDLTNSIILNFRDEIRISHLLVALLHAKVIEHRHQHCSDHQPQQQISGNVVQSTSSLAAF